MVGPIPDADRRRTLLQLKAGLVLLVGASTGLVAVEGGASLPAVAGSVAVGLVVGLALAWWLFPDLERLSPASDRHQR